MEEFLIDKPTMHVIMMLSIDESYAFLAIPGGKRRLGESSKRVQFKKHMKKHVTFQ